jgi:hypothetical protein
MTPVHGSKMRNVTSARRGAEDFGDPPSDATVIGNMDPGNVGLRSPEDGGSHRNDVVVLGGDEITRLCAFVDNPDE